MTDQRYENMPNVKSQISVGLAALASVQSEVSAMVDDALPIDGGVPPINVLTYGYALIKEITELADELGWKPWKPRRVIDQSRVADEFADVLAFLGLITLYVMRLANLGTSDLAAAYLRKSDVNVARFSGKVEDYVRRS